jgi:methionyl aminopeptidase
MTPAEVVSSILKTIETNAKPGVNLLTLEHLAESMIQVMGAVSVNKGYQPKWARLPFPSVICLGVNDVISHGIPISYDLKEGDTLYIDLGISIDGMCGDAGLTVPIGRVENKDERLLRYAKRALYKGISVIQPGVKVTEVGEVIERYALQNGYRVNKKFWGHGISKTMHEEPRIPHCILKKEEVKTEVKPGKFKYEYKDPEGVPTFEVGQVVCIEPMLTYGKDEFGASTPDGWTVKTRDHKRSAFFEHMVRVTSEGHEILTYHIEEEVS